MFSVQDLFVSIFWAFVSVGLIGSGEGYTPEKAVQPPFEIRHDVASSQGVFNEKHLPTIAENDYQYYDVVKVFDGDTISIDINGQVETIRMIGINTPETVDPRRMVECFGREASDKAKDLMSGKKVRIEGDDSQSARDKYGRLLAYIYLEDGLLVNEYMIEDGYAYEYTFDTAYKYQYEFISAEKSAQMNRKGLWNSDVCFNN